MAPMAPPPNTSLAVVELMLTCRPNAATYSRISVVKWQKSMYVKTKMVHQKPFLAVFGDP